MWVFNTFAVFGMLALLIVCHILLLSYMEASWLSQVCIVIIKNEKAGAREMCLRGWRKPLGCTERERARDETTPALIAGESYRGY